MHVKNYVNIGISLYFLLLFYCRTYIAYTQYKGRMDGMGWLW